MRRSPILFPRRDRGAARGCDDGTRSASKAKDATDRERSTIAALPTVPDAGTDCVEKVVTKGANELIVCWEAFKDSDGYGRLTLDTSDGVRVTLGEADPTRTAGVAADTEDAWLRLELDGDRLVGLVFLGEEGKRRLPVTVTNVLGGE